jgi:hypothetical protein
MNVRSYKDFEKYLGAKPRKLGKIEPLSPNILTLEQISFLKKIS